MKNLLNSLDPLLGHHKQKIVYLFVGGLLFLIDFVGTLFAYYALDFPAGYASALGFMASFVVGFSLNKQVVFKHDKQSRFPAHTQVTLYLLLAFINLFITSYIVGFAVNAGVEIYVIKPIVVIAAACWNFVILGRFIFGHKKA